MHSTWTRAWNLVVIVMMGAAAASAQTTAGRAGAAGPAAAAPARPAGEVSLAGTWTAKVERLPLTSEFEASVYGPNAVSERTVNVVIKAGGEGTLTVTRRVLDARGRAVRGAGSTEVANFRIGAPRPAVAGRVDYAIEMTGAERRYADDPTYKWSLDGARVGVASFPDDRNSLEVRFDTPEGRGSFAELVTRQAAAPKRAAE